MQSQRSTMASHRRVTLGLIFHLASVAPHAVMVEPPPRFNIGVPRTSPLPPTAPFAPGGCSFAAGAANPCPIGTKLPGFGNAYSTANSHVRGCGGAENLDAANPDQSIQKTQRPTVAFTPGSAIDVTWALTVPHQADILDAGVRIAIHYADTDSFECNVRRRCCQSSSAPLAARASGPA